MFWKLAAKVPLSTMTFRPAIALLKEPLEIIASPETSEPPAEAGPTTIVTAPPAAVRFVVPATPRRFDTETIVAVPLTVLTVPVRNSTASPGPRYRSPPPGPAQPTWRSL